MERETVKDEAAPVLHFGHSPDADDAFMFCALASGRVRVPGARIEHVIDDIQSLNRRALSAELPVTAVSAAVYPRIAKDYWVLSSGASVGRGYGPIVVAPRAMTRRELSGRRIAVPGPETTAYLLLRIYLEDFVPVQMNFQEILPAVRSGQAEAGLIIHEGQLNFASAGAVKCLDLGSLWSEETGLPIPLGLDVARKDLGMDRAGEISRALKASVAWARAHEDEAIDYALRYARGTDRETARRFVRMYVNEDTLDLGDDGLRALEELFASGSARGLCGSPGRIQLVS